jgi:hypothetical protein
MEGSEKGGVKMERMSDRKGREKNSDGGKDEKSVERVMEIREK